MERYHLNNKHIQNPLRFNDILLHQVGTMYCSQTTVVGTHNHLNWFELTVVTDGEGEILTNGVAVPVKRQDIYLSFPCETHEIRSGFRQPLKFDFFSFWPESEPFKSELEKIMQSCADADKRIFRDERVRTLVEGIISELADDRSFLSFDSVYASMKLILIQLIRAFRNETQKSGFQVNNPEVLCHQLMQYMDTHVYTMKNLSELADLMGYNYSYLSALYKKTTGETLADYFMSRKLETAKQLIVQQNLTVSKISELLNYSSVYAFSKAFRNRCGISPREFKNRI